jgi:hypothetical protein
MVGKGSNVPIIAVDDVESAAALADTYALPQDAIIRVPAPSAKEDISTALHRLG